VDYFKTLYYYTSYSLNFLFINNIIYDQGGLTMGKYVCSVCGYVYDPAVGDPENGVEPGTAFADLPDDWVCPVCGAEKSQFEPEA